MFSDRTLLWHLWLHYGLGFDDPVEWGRARLAWQYQLSREEIKTVELIAAACTNDEIAERLQIAETNTVKNRIRKIFTKMSVSDRVQIAVIATQFGLGPKTVPPTDSKE